MKQETIDLLKKQDIFYAQYHESTPRTQLLERCEADIKEIHGDNLISFQVTKEGEVHNVNHQRFIYYQLTLKEKL